MRALVSSLAGLMLVVHLVLGCCWHHDHPCGTAGYRLCAELTERCAGDMASHQNHDADHDDGGHHDCNHEHGPAVPGGEHCHGEHCSFLVLSKVQLDSGSGVAAAVAAIADMPAASHANLTWLATAGGSADHPPPIPLHLLHRTLRI